MDIARIALYESTIDFQDVFFSLVSILFQQLTQGLADASRTAGTLEKTRDDERVLQAMLSLVFSGDPQLLRRCSAKVLSAPPAFLSRAARRSHYSSEMRELATFSDGSTRMTLEEDRKACSRSQRAFLNVFQPKISEMVHALVASLPTALHDNDWQRMTAPLAVCDRHGERGEAEQELLATAASQPSNRCDSDAAAISGSLAFMFASYAILCSWLRVPRVCVDILHILAVARLRRTKLLTKDQLTSFVVNAGQCRYLETQLSATYDSMEAARTMEQVLEYARKSRALELLVEFCSVSGSMLAHECLKALCVAQAKLGFSSTDIVSETRVAAAWQPKTLHLLICERYISEMVGLLRELPLVLQFKHSVQGTEAITSDTLGFAAAVVEQRFELYSKAIRTELNDVSETQTQKHPGGSCARFWRHASREARVRSRCLSLKTRVLWHLRQLATSDEQTLEQVFERVFLLDFLSGRCGNVEEAKLIAKFIDKAQDAVSSGRWQETRQAFGDQHQSFARSSQCPINSRRDKIVRFVALITWAIWVRERCAYCLRSIELLHDHDRLRRSEHISDAERKRVGSLAATCALQLNALGVLVAKPDDIFALQISLLEDSVKLNREKAAAVICWAFPADKVQARYLKRYKALRQALKADASEESVTVTASIEETEHRCQFIQRHVKKSIRWSISSGAMKSGSMYTESPKKHEMSRSWTSETDVLVDCCCNLEFQKLTWALIQKRFASGATRDSRSDTVSTKQLTNVVMPSSDSTTESAISRREVIALLQDQRRELDTKVRSRSTDSPVRAIDDKRSTLQRDRDSVSVPQGAVRATIAGRQSTSSQRIAVRDIDFESDGGAFDAVNRKRKQPHRAERRESVQNVLKLLSLRKQHDAAAPVRSRSSPDFVRRVDLQIAHRAASSGCTPNGFDGVPSPKRHALEANSERSVFGTSLPATEVEEERRSVSGKDRNGSAASPVFPLRYNAGGESASIQLLDWRHVGGRVIPLKPRQFSFQRRERTASKPPDRVHTLVTMELGCKSTEGHNAAGLKSVGVQTMGGVADTVQSQALQAPIGPDNDRTVDAERKSDAATQSETVTQCAASDTSVASVQCSLKEKPLREAESGGEARSVIEGVLRKFPIFIDMDSSTQTPSAKQRFLQVVRFTDPLSSEQGSCYPIERVINVVPHDADGVASAPPADTEGIVECLNQESANPAPAESQSAATSERVSPRESRAAAQARYRRHFAAPTAGSTSTGACRKSSATSSGRNSLLGMKKDIERLKSRLAQLEHCADEIDYDFRTSHHVRPILLLASFRGSYITYPSSSSCGGLATGSHWKGARQPRTCGPGTRVSRY